MGNQEEVEWNRGRDEEKSLGKKSYSPEQKCLLGRWHSEARTIKVFQSALT